MTWDRRGRCQARSRRGSFLIEMALSAAMLMIAMGLTVKVLGWVGVQRKTWDRRQVAVQEAANLMEHLTALPFDQVRTESTQNLPLSARAKQMLPEVKVMVDVQENDQAGGTGSKRVGLQLRWKGRSGEWDAPVHLATWIFRGRPGS